MALLGYALLACGEGGPAVGWEVAAGSDGRLRLEEGIAPGDANPSSHLTYSFGGTDEPPAVALWSLGDRDVTPFDHLALEIRGDARRGFGESLKVQLRRRDPADGSMETGSFVVTGIGASWQRVEIPLNRMPGLRHRDHVESVALVLQARRPTVPTGGYYLGEPELVRTGRPGPSARDPVPAPRKRAWEREVGGAEAAHRLLPTRLVGWPGPEEGGTAALPEDAEAFLWQVARDTWRGLDALRDAESGLPVDTVRFPEGSLRVADGRVGDFTNVTNVGLFLASLVAARELGLLAPDQAAERAAHLVATLEGLESHRGFFYNYYDTTSCERSSHFVSFVDSSWLTVGLLLARDAFPGSSERFERLVARADYEFFYDPVEQLMSHGHWVNLDVPSEYHYGWLFTEARVGSLLAIGKGDVPRAHWDRLVALSTPGPGPPAHRPRQSADRWGGVAFVPSWGGSMFEALMPVLVVDEPALAPEGLGRNDLAHAVIQRRYAAESLGAAVWGASPALSPVRDRYEEYGVPVLGLAGYPAGVVAPYAAALALAVEPAEAVADLRRLAAVPGLYGPYGFYDALDPETGAVAHAYLALDQAMLFLALANHLEDGVVRRRFAADPIVERILPLVAGVRLFDR